MKMFKILLSVIFLTLISTSNVFAGTLKLSLSKLPEYKNSSYFRLYYTYFETEGKTATVNLYVQKEGKGWNQTVEKNKTSVSGYFEVGGNDLAEGEGKYNFYAIAKTDEQTITSLTVSTTLDQSAPSAPTEYSKERINSTTYKLSWKNPFDEDFSKVYIYRSKETSFTADVSTRIGEAGGARDEKMTFNDGSVESNVDYYYALRAIDRAGNASGVVTDAPGTVTAGQVAGVSTAVGPGQAGVGGEGTVKILPIKDSEIPTEGVTQKGELGGGISDQQGEIQGSAIENITKRPIVLIGILAVGLLAAIFIWINRKKV